MSEDERWLMEALAEAKLAELHGDVPIGCIIVAATGDEIGRGRNRRELLEDPTAHAEVLALREAARHVQRWRLDGATAYVTLEPCAMCAGAFVNSRIARVVFAAPDPKAGAVVSLFSLGTDTRLNHRFAVSGGLLAAESVGLLRGFFRERR